ncbi:hypothetical protein AVEN_186628-1 [Araneus ventricosus]|uniref:RNase H type-1 domain-containing protein n=1 Tax=Araneus ventricosus TaxID=182803 RepID=A0A4Y2U8T8_ARAVE|nr:hypothetical protein AVEN_186628-1 [Araneus ventricosus]
MHFDHESYEQPSPPSIIHPELFRLEDRISRGGQDPSNRTTNEVYTDGSKTNDQTGSAFCAIANTKPSLKPGRPSSAQPILCSKQKC